MKWIEYDWGNGRTLRVYVASTRAQFENKYCTYIMDNCMWMAKNTQYIATIVET